jgi:hypothetical protein
LTGSILYKDLAAKVHLLTGTVILPSDLRRLIRLAIANNMFHEPKIGSVAHNRTSLLLLEDASLASWAAFYTTDLLAPIANTVAAMRMWPESQEANQTVRTGPTISRKGMLTHRIAGRKHCFQS